MGLLGEIGDMMILTGKTLVSAIRPPYVYGNEFSIQFLFALRLCWLPLLITSLCVNYAVPGIQGGGFQEMLGSIDRLGSFYSLADIREFAPLVCVIIVSGVAGTAITADLGARKIREELDALQVLGVDPIKNLVVPRFLALMVATALFDIFAIATGVAGGVLATWTHHAPMGPFFSQFWAGGSTTDVWGSLLKCTLFGAITAIVCCYKGMTVSGGAEGVGRAVNQAVVICLLAVGSFNYVFTQTLLATHPDMMVLK
jgi:phospholipid/cholesterol/gamma-HCH transport system permease protein